MSLVIRTLPRQHRSLANLVHASRSLIAIHVFSSTAISPSARFGAITRSLLRAPTKSNACKNRSELEFAVCMLCRHGGLFGLASTAVLQTQHYEPELLEL